METAPPLANNSLLQFPFLIGSNVFQMQEEKVHHLKLVQANQNLLTSTITSPEVALHHIQNSMGARRDFGLV